MDNEQYRKGLTQLKSELQQIVADAPFAAAQTVLGSSLNRIFNRGKNTYERQIGEYSNTFSVKFNKSTFTRLNKLAQRRTKESVDKIVTYKQLRIKAGRQVGYVDLQFTGALFESIKVGKSGNFAVIGFNNTELAIIARQNEVRFKSKIFTPSEEEMSEAKRLMKAYVINKMRESIQNIFNA